MKKDDLLRITNYRNAFYLLIIIFFGICLILNSFHSILSFGYGLDDYYLVSRSFKEAFIKNFEIGQIHFRPIWYLSYPLTNIISNSSSFHHFISGL